MINSKTKPSEYLNQLIRQTELAQKEDEEAGKSIFDKIDNFQFEIKIDKVSVAKSQFCGNYFPPKVRYAVDVREIIPSIMSEIRYSLSQKNYTIVGA